jgi:peptide/nickel transport system permease protein
LILALHFRKIKMLNRKSISNPWLNTPLVCGALVIGLLLSSTLIGNIFWDTELAATRSAPLNLPPYGFENMRKQEGVIEHPLGTTNSGRDMLAVMLVGTPATMSIGFIAAGIGMLIGIILGFTSGFYGGLWDDFVRLMADTTTTIPALAVLIVVQSLFRVEVNTMAAMIALFAWPGPTRYIRAQVLTMRESGYVKMAKLSGAPERDIMFKEMLPNLIPYLAASFIGNTSGAILTAIGLEVLGLGPTRMPTLGVTIFFSLEAAAILRDMWWWWGLPTLTLIVIFMGLLMINVGLDEVSNPRLRKAS